MARPVQIVLDTNVLVAALRSKTGAANLLMQSLFRDQKWRLHVSTPLLFEYEAVLKRPEMRNFVSTTDVDDLIDAICSIASDNEIFYLWRFMVRDPKDAFVFELAIRASVDYLITFNSKDFPNAEKFGVKLVTPRDFLTIVGEIT